jgi:hypothetical protein
VLTGVFGGALYGLMFFPTNWIYLAPYFQPVEHMGQMSSIADLMFGGLRSIVELLRTNLHTHVFVPRRMVMTNCDGTRSLESKFPWSGLTCTAISMSRSFPL